VIVEVGFTCTVFAYGTRFLGRAFDSRTEELPQEIVAGDATPKVATDRLWVATTLGGEVLSNVTISPEAFTPNGDGVNDVTIISYTLLRLDTPTPVRIVVYDLAGREIRKVYSSKDVSGTYHVRWDGRDDWQRIAPPGLYIYRLFVETDTGESVSTGSVVVAY
jgi:hypothetical protein